MTHQILVAEPSNDTWTSIAHGLRRYQPEATVLRVKDGEQVVRCLFEQGLLMEEPETPNVIVLNAQLSIVPMNALMERIRQHPRTQAIPVIVICQDVDRAQHNAGTESEPGLLRDSNVIMITGARPLEKEVAEAMHRLHTA